MKKGGGKQKGSSFERTICKRLSLWISEGKREDIFWRSAMSGGRATVQFKKGKENKSQVGDISSIDQIGQKFTDKFVIECKSYSNIHLESLIYGKPKKGCILEFWEKVKKQALNISKSPLIIFKENGKEILLGCSEYFEVHILNSFYKPLGFYPNHELYIFSFDMVLKEVDPYILEII